MDARRAFADYMTKHGWVVVNCTTEADLAIVQACLPTDIVLSRDSDMIYYASIRTIWRPISKGRVLVYDVREVMATLGLNQAQFTVLGMVSRNDYNRNIPSLGSATNYTIVKELKEQDPIALLGSYLRHGRVVLKNTNQETFAASRSVFLELSQTILQPDPVPCQGSLTYDGLHEKFQALSQRYLLRQEGLKDARQAEKSASTDVVDGLPGSHSNSIRYTTTPLLIALKRMKHRSSARKGIKLYLGKQPKASARTAKKKELKPITSTTGKTDLFWAMVREHPKVSLDLGTVQANVQRSPVESDLEPHIMKCLQDITQNAARIKRSGQKLIGLFIEAAFVSPEPSDRVDSEEQEEENDQDEEDPEYTKSEHVQFFSVLLNYLYNEHPINTKTAVGKRVQQFIDRAVELQVWQASGNRSRSERMPYPASSLLRSVASELCTEVKRMYRHGSIELEKKLELMALLWQNEAINQKIQTLALKDFEVKSIRLAQPDVLYWLQEKPPGFLLSALLSGRGYTAIQLRPANGTSYVLLMERLPLYILPTEMGDLQCQFQGLVKILQVRAAMRTTIELHKELQIAKTHDENEEVDDSQSYTDVSWMYKEPPAEFNSSVVVASSPIAPSITPCGSGVDDDHDSDHA
ncbi:hypothetical protein BGZ72_008850 [Mortierella alpina]|nr:hypothetical protein BGZ72_008850 [Mortierella alpina]